MRTPHEIMCAMHDGEITVDQAADEARAWLADQREAQGMPPEKQFDQQERRLLFGYPVIIKEQP